VEGIALGDFECCGIFVKEDCVKIWWNNITLNFLELWLMLDCRVHPMPWLKKLNF
jgi:hypothetical protein